jgi:catechol 2,3-dioxygenase-like lactoylglutathione lyase family enzyme
MQIEHVALSVPDPAAGARWYVEHVGCTLVRAEAETPYAHFLLLPGGGVTIELFRSPRAPVPDYRRVDPLQGHLAFRTDDIDGTCSRLLAAGATAEDEPGELPNGDRYAMLRDPWGVPLQLVRRVEKLF